MGAVHYSKWRLSAENELAAIELRTVTLRMNKQLNDYDSLKIKYPCYYLKLSSKLLIILVG